MKKLNEIFNCKKILVFLAMVFALLLQTSIFTTEIRPDFLFVAALIYAFYDKDLKNIAVVSLVCGVVCDFVCHNHVIGYTAFYPYAAVTLRLLCNMFYKLRLLFGTIVCFLIVLSVKVIKYPFLSAKGEFKAYFSNIAIRKSFIDAILFFLIILAFMLFNFMRRKRNVSYIQ